MDAIAVRVAARFQASENERYKTYPVAAPAYMSKHDKPMLTHTYDEQTHSTLCKRVKADNLLFDEIWDGEGSTDRKPTCALCLKRDPRF